MLYRLLTALKERFYPVLVKKTPAYFNHIKEDRLIKANSRTSRLESDKSFLCGGLNELQAS